MGKGNALRFDVDPQVGLYPRGRVQEERAWVEIVSALHQSRKRKRTGVCFTFSREVASF